MIHYQPEVPHIIFLFSDTGGGHRSAAEAIIEAVNLEYPNQINMEMVDIFKEYAPPPLNRAPEIYPPLSRMPSVWQFGYRASNGHRRTKAINDALWPYVSRSIWRLVNENPCDLFVSVHPLVNTPVLHALERRSQPLVTVVTDLVSTHAFWYDPRAIKVIVPTEAARERGLEMGVSSEQMEVIGLPVADRFCQPGGGKAEIRDKLGWMQDIPTVLLVGGGEGMGPLEQTALAINEAQFPVALVIIAGRNRKLKAKLERQTWNVPVYIYGFVRDMPDFMRAADILVTKAGPGTICEAFIAGLPLILYSRLPGQEDGNVDYVINEKAGIWAPTPDKVVRTIKNWIESPEKREEVAATCRRLARPDAARRIARVLAAGVGVSKK